MTYKQRQTNAYAEPTAQRDAGRSTEQDPEGNKRKREEMEADHERTQGSAPYTYGMHIV